MICGERSLSQPVPCLPIHFLSQVTAASNCFWIIPQIQKVHIQTNTDFYFLPHPFYTKDNLLYPVSISCYFPFTLYFGGLSIHVHRELHSVFIDLPNPGIKPRSPALQEASLPAEPPGKPKNTRVGRLSLLHGNLPDPGIELRSPVLQVDSLPAEPPGKPKNTREGSLSLLQRIYPAQK